MHSVLSRLPKVDQLLAEPEILELLAAIPRPLVLRAIHETLDAVRTDVRIAGGREVPSLEPDAIRRRIVARARELQQPHFRRVVNATGVIVHTNLGRSLMAPEALEAVAAAGANYSNLEYDLEAGRRGSRYSHVEDLLKELTGAEAALVVNNNAAAVLITLMTLARGREVIVSRGELVEIGGSFRIPDVMTQSGAVLREVGTTNKTHPADYERALGPDTALLLKVHQSNFRVIGFTELVEASDLAGIAGRAGVPLVEDLGSGSMTDLSVYGLRREPTVRETVSAGVDICTFSGDKLLGGPQAGVIVGRKVLLEQIRKNPLNRAMRIDKFTLAALEATLRLYLEPERAVRRIPTLAMIAAPYAELSRRAARLRRAIDRALGDRAVTGLIDGFSRVGGGALPEEGLKTRLVTVAPRDGSVNRLENGLRRRPVPVIGRIENDRLLLDVRTMTDDDFHIVAEALAAQFGEQE